LIEVLFQNTLLLSTYLKGKKKKKKKKKTEKEREREKAYRKILFSIP